MMNAATEETPIITENRQNKSSLNLHLILALLACTLGSPFQIGFNTAILNTPAQVLKTFYNETYYSRHGQSMSDNLLTILWAVTVSALCVGGIVGAAVVPIVSLKLGRKTILLWNNVLALLSSGLQTYSKYAQSYELLIIGRVLAGIMCGVVTVISPNYLSEIAPVDLRGFCGSSFPLALICGIFVAQIFGSNSVFGTNTLWPIIFAFIALPAIYSFLTLSWCPESPRYLMLTKSDEHSATKALRWLRETNDVSAEIESMKKEKEETQNTPKFTFMDLWRLPELRWALIISFVLQISLQLTGINIITFYSTSIYEMANLSLKVSQFLAIGTTLSNILVTLMSAIIVDKVGRKKLLLTGLIGMLISTLVLVVCLVFQKSTFWLSYISVVCVFMFVIFIASGPGSVPWFMMAELFEQGPRTTAVSTAIICNWFCIFLVGLCFPIIQATIGYYSFLPSAGVITACVIFIYTYVPETKGKSILEITGMFKQTTRKGNDKDFLISVNETKAN